VIHAALFRCCPRFTRDSCVTIGNITRNRSEEGLSEKTEGSTKGMRRVYRTTVLGSKGSYFAAPDQK
jgi:hypothetical protein